jgi:broad specificity phosphatase PhoE
VTKIVLLRHGRSQIPAWPRIPPRDMGQWIDACNQSGIAPDFPPPAVTLEAVGACRVLICSDWPRSVESARSLTGSDPYLIDPLFRELGLPHGDAAFPLANPKNWVTFFRLLWFIGYRRNSESLAEGKLRAKAAAAKLAGLAQVHGPVLLAGHGMMNRFIAAELRRSGWRGPKTPGRRYWEFGVYEYPS